MSIDNSSVNFLLKKFEKQISERLNNYIDQLSPEEALTHLGHLKNIKHNTNSIETILSIGIYEEWRTLNRNNKDSLVNNFKENTELIEKTYQQVRSQLKKDPINQAGCDFFERVNKRMNKNIKDE